MEVFGSDSNGITFYLSCNIRDPSNRNVAFIYKASKIGFNCRLYVNIWMCRLLMDCTVYKSTTNINYKKKLNKNIIINKNNITYIFYISFNTSNMNSICS